MAKNLERRIRNFADNEQWTSALSLLSIKKAHNEVDTAQVSVRALIHRICTGFIENNDLGDSLFPRRMIRLKERCHDADWLLEFGELRYGLEDYDTALQSFTSARLDRLQDTGLTQRREHVQALLTQKGKDLCAKGLPLTAFDYFETASPFVLTSDQELNDQFTKTANNFWHGAIEDVQNPEHFMQMGLPKIVKIFEATGRPDLLFQCGKQLQALWQKEQDTIIQNGVLPTGKSWVHHVKRTYKAALYLRGQQQYDLQTPQLNELGTFLLLFHDTDSAMNAFTMSENTQLLRSYAVQFLSGGVVQEVQKAIQLLESDFSTYDHPQIKSALVRAISLVTMELEKVPVASREYNEEIRIAKRKAIESILHDCVSLLNQFTVR